MKKTSIIHKVSMENVLHNRQFCLGLKRGGNDFKFEKLPLNIFFEFSYKFDLKYKIESENYLV